MRLQGGIDGQTVAQDTGATYFAG